MSKWRDVEEICGEVENYLAVQKNHSQHLLVYLEDEILFSLKLHALNNGMR